MKACTRKQLENSGKNAAVSGFPHFSGQSKVNEVGCEESRQFSSFGFIMAALVKFSLCFGPGKVSL